MTIMSRIAIYATILSCVCALGIVLATYWTQRRNDARAIASQHCQDDLKNQIAALQNYYAAQKTQQSEGESRDPVGAASLQEKAKAIQAFKSRC